MKGVTAVRERWLSVHAGRRTKIVYGLCAAVLVIAAGFSLASFQSPVPRIQDWTGVLRYHGPREAPYGWINTTAFNVMKEDGQPVGSNISASTMDALDAFFFASTSAGTMQVVVRDEGAYRTVALRANATELSIFLDPGNFSYLTASNCNYKVTVLGSVSIFMHPLSFLGGYYTYPVFTANASRSGAPFSSLFEYSPAAARSSVLLSGRGFTLTTNGTTMNLTGQATLTLSGFSRAGLSVYEHSQLYTMPEGARLVFESASFDLRNLNGTIGSPQAGQVVLHDATVRIGSTTSAVLQMAYPLNDQDQSTTLDFQAQGAIVDLAQSGQPRYPGAEMVEPASLTWARAFTIGLSTFLGGLFLDRARVRSK